MDQFLFNSDYKCIWFQLKKAAFINRKILKTDFFYVISCLKKSGYCFLSDINFQHNFHLKFCGKFNFMFLNLSIKSLQSSLQTLNNYISISESQIFAHNYIFSNFIRCHLVLKLFKSSLTSVFANKVFIAILTRVISPATV